MNRAQLKKAREVVYEAVALDKMIREIDSITRSVRVRKSEKDTRLKVTTYRVSIYACTPNDPHGYKRSALCTEFAPGEPMDEFLSVLQGARKRAKARLAELSL